ncbi:hypothetical protein KKI24_25835 [bacterium]|nr:hypothetical protein [bacterium]
MAKIDYLSVYKRFQKYDGTLKQFCETRRPKLGYSATKKGISRLRQQGKIDEKVDAPKTENVTNATAKKSKSRARWQQLTHRQQKLIEQQLSSVGQTNAQMAKNAGYNSTNLSKSFINATKGDTYQEALAKSRAELRKMIGIPGLAILIRLIEIGLSRLRDIVKLENGTITLREDVTFDDGADLTIQSITVRENETVTEHRTDRRTELRVVTSDNQTALTSALKIGGYFDNSVFNSIASGNEDIKALWRQFKDKEMSAIDLSNELSMQGLDVPKSVLIQAQAELKKIYSKSDDDLDNIDMMESYDEMLEDAAIAKKKLEVETERKKELLIREKELAELNKKTDALDDGFD